MSKPDSESGGHSAEIDELVERYLKLAEQDSAPAIDVYAREFPQHELELVRILQTMNVVQRLQPAPHRTVKTGSSAVESAPVIEDYRLIRVAGRGGMGVVYEAIQVSLDRKVALKVLPQVLFQNQRARQRFQLEAKAAAQLHHSNIVPVHDVGICNEHYYYAMQFIEGNTLDHVISQLRSLRDHPEDVSRLGLPANDEQAAGGKVRSRKEKPLDAMASDAARCLTIALSLNAYTNQSGPSTPANVEALPLDITIDSDGMAPALSSDPTARQSEASGGSNNKKKSSTFGSSSGNKPFFLSVARIGRQTAEALHYAHESGVVHRDIKPANLMLDTHGQVWITDFGLAKLSDANDLTRDGDVVGTLRYMAPERFEGKCDERSDVFSLGVTLYELLALQSPFDATDRMQLINQIKHSTPPSLRSLNRKVPYDLQTIIEKAMDSQPNRRYPTAQELAADLERFYDGRPILARRVSAFEKLWLWSKQNVGLAAALATVLLLLAAGTIGSTIAAIAFRASREEAREQSQLAYDTLNQVLFDLQESLAEIPAASGARRRLLNTALKGLEKTSQQFVTSNNTDRRLAIALQQLSRLALTTGASGNIDQSALNFAETAARRAVAISQKILDEQPNNSLAIRDMSISLSRLAAVQRAKAELASARESYQQSLLLSQRNLTINPDHKQALQDAAQALSNLGNLESTALQHQTALENYQAAHRHVLEVLEITPDDGDVQRSEALALINIGNTLLRIEGLGAHAQEKLEVALEHFQWLYDRQPDNVNAQRDLSLALESISDVFSRAGNHKARLDVIMRSHVIAQQMLAVDPKNMDLLIGMAESTSKLGDIQNTLKDSKSAQQSYARAWEICEELYATYPQSNVVRKMLCMQLTLHGQMARDLGNYDVAITAFERARDVALAHKGDSESGDFYGRWVETMNGTIEDTVEGKESGHPPEYWLEPPPGWVDQDNPNEQAN